MELTSTNYLPSYTVGVDAYKAVPEVTRRFGSTAVIIGGKTAMEKAASRLLGGPRGHGRHGHGPDLVWRPASPLRCREARR